MVLREMGSSSYRAWNDFVRSRYDVTADILPRFTVSTAAGRLRKEYGELGGIYIVVTLVQMLLSMYANDVATPTLSPS